MTERLRDERGASAVEFAFIVPLLIVLVLGIAEFGHAFQVQGTLSAAAREGVRLMALQNDPAAARDGGPQRRGVAGPGDHRRPDRRSSPASCPSHRRRQHRGPPDHQLPDALPHRLLRLEPRPDRNGSHAMQRLTRPAAGAGSTASAAPPRWCSSLLLVPMLGFAAIAVDIGALYAERARLQVAADAAAIAVAQDCSRGNCGDMLATAQAPGHRQRRRGHRGARRC